jgi:hypothetical protein
MVEGAGVYHPVPREGVYPLTETCRADESIRVGGKGGYNNYAV